MSLNKTLTNFIVKQAVALPMGETQAELRDRLSSPEWRSLWRDTGRNPALLRSAQLKQWRDNTLNGRLSGGSALSSGYPAVSHKADPNRGYSPPSNYYKEQPIGLTNDFSVLSPRHSMGVRG